MSYVEISKGRGDAKQIIGAAAYLPTQQVGTFTHVQSVGGGWRDPRDPRDPRDHTYNNILKMIIFKCSNSPVKWQKLSTYFDFAGIFPPFFFPFSSLLQPEPILLSILCTCAHQVSAFFLNISLRGLPHENIYTGKPNFSQHNNAERDS